MKMNKETQHHTELSAVYGDIDGIEDGRIFPPEAELSYEDELTQFILTSLRTAMHEGVKTVALPAVSFAESKSDDDTARIAVHTVRSFLQEYPDAFDTVEWIIPDRKLSFLYTKAILGIV